MQTHGAPADGWLQRFLAGVQGVPLTPGLSHSLPLGQTTSSAGLHLQFAVSLLSAGHSASASGGHSQEVQSELTANGATHFSGQPQTQFFRQNGFLGSVHCADFGPGGSQFSPASILVFPHAFSQTQVS